MLTSIIRALIILYLSNVNSFRLGGKPKAKQLLHIDRFAMCEVVPNSPIQVDFINLKFSEEIGTHGSTNFTFTRDLKSDKLNYAIKLDRCASREALDQCEFFTAMRPPSICGFLDLRNVPWETITSNMHPPLKCPLKKGKYSGNNLYLDPNIFDMFPLDNYYWRSKTAISEEKLKLGTVCVDFRVVPSKGSN